ncbi:MAG TPA: hypothetical protein PKM88_01330 [bacterium]|nr:hypothetical protein [bacterium]
MKMLQSGRGAGHAGAARQCAGGWTASVAARAPVALLAVAVLTVLLAAAVPCRAARLTVGYGDLVERGQLVRNGRTLGETLRQRPLAPAARGMVQPFLDGYATLLAQAVDMLEGPPAQTMQDVAELFPPGTAQPAWVAICRSGRIRLETDGAGNVRVFAPGDDARGAYRAAYGVLRHPLAALAAGRAAAGESPTLAISVYAYRHDYGQSEYSLNTAPYRLQSAAFPSPANSIAVDLDALAAFFAQGALLTGATRSAADGLVLDGEPGSGMPLAGGTAALSDLAVAYRAVFHAGDNTAFISLDPHRDPTLATVNFGGLLENTRLGVTVLEADKRFKMIGTGLNPNTFTDERAAARAQQPAFLTSAERDCIAQAGTGDQWVGTRFWFYPETVEVETDPQYRQAIITSARFTADAERQRGDFASEQEFARSRTKLSPGIRGCIDDLNRQYAQYAAAFPELRELTTVARLLGICSWLKRGRGAPLDLDALLAVELPACTTPADKPQMVAANWLAVPRAGGGLDTATVAQRMVADYLTPLLDDPAGSHFADSAALARALPSRRRSMDWEHDRERPLRALITTIADLQGVAVQLAALRAQEQVRRSIGGDPAISAALHELQQLDDALGSAAPEARPTLWQERQDAAAALDASVAANYPGGVSAMHVISIGGGINLGPDEFSIRVRPARTAAANGARVRPAATLSSATVHSRPSATRPAAAAVPQPVALRQRPTAVVRTDTRSIAPAAGSRTVLPAARQSWSETVTVAGASRQRSYDARTRTLLVQAPGGSQLRGRLQGNRLVFTRPAVPGDTIPR